jgi:methyl-accepting chemotaxis protein
MKWSLTKRIVSWGLVMAFIVVVLSGFCIHRLALFQEYSRTSYDNATIPLKACGQLIMAFATLQSQITDHIATSETDKMKEIETAIETTLTQAQGFLKGLGSARDEELEKRWAGIVLLSKDALKESRGQAKFEALNRMNSGEGLEQIVGLGRKMSLILNQSAEQAQESQNNSQLLGTRTKKYVTIVSIFSVAMSIIIGLILARSIGRPLITLSDVAAKISEGDLRVDVPIEKRTDEIGRLSEAFASMLVSLKDQSSRMIEVVLVLSSVAKELTTTMSQLGDNGFRTSAAVTEVSTTMHQVSQAARLASTKASNVVQTSDQALKTSDLGRDATEKTIDRINVIREQMTLIGETVVKLSEQSRAIEDIVSSVQDLADQSNLLAVNASIEAARAGDQGKGFAVVANEIKTLADESKAATNEIRTILSNTRQCVSAVVMATEQGTKAVESGVEQSRVTGEAIRSLVESVANSAQAAGIINASSNEQLAGTEQASSAMMNIEQAMRENLNVISQVEESAKKLEDLGRSLDQLVNYYRL